VAKRREGIDWDFCVVERRNTPMASGFGFDDYQAFTRTTAIYPGNGEKTVEAISYCLFKLCGETGEIAEKVGKLMRGGGGFQAIANIDDETRQELAKEIGDCAWYIARLADELGLKLSDVASLNVKKLTSRKERNVLHGEGDNR
jgi:NTP pyrophosphatase (non-canonical NTP hydrolase)